MGEVDAVAVDEQEVLDWMQNKIRCDLDLVICMLLTADEWYPDWRSLSGEE